MIEMGCDATIFFVRNSTAFLKNIVSWIWHHKRVSLIFLIILGIALYIIWPKPGKPIETQKVMRGDVVQSLAVNGSVASSENAGLNFLTGGKLTYLGVKKGDSVNKGQVIATLDLRSVQKNLELALRDYAKQRNTFEQTKDTYKDQVVTDQVKRVLENNQYDLDKAVLSTELQDLSRQNSSLISPISGVVTRADVDVSGTNISATTTFVVSNVDDLVFNAEVDEADIGKVQEGMPVKITLDAYPNQTITLPVDSIDYASHTTSTGGTSYYVKMSLSNNAGDQYRIGMNGDADIILNQKNNVLKIPTSAITDKEFVYVQNGSKFAKKKITIGLQSDTESEVLEGLTEQDVVVVQPSSLSQQQKS